MWETILIYLIFYAVVFGTGVVFAAGLLLLAKTKCCSKWNEKTEKIV